MKSLQLRGLKVQMWSCVFMKMLEMQRDRWGSAFQQLSGEMLTPMLFSVCFTAGQCNKLYFGGWG